MRVSRLLGAVAVVCMLAPSAWAAGGAVIEDPEAGLRLRVGGYVQGDARIFFGDDEERALDQIVLRRVRPILEGTVFSHWDFRVMPDLASATPTLQEAYVDAHYVEWLRLRAGKLKEPFGIERLVSATNLLFVERALPTLLAPNRDVGMQLWGDAGFFQWALGVFDGTPDGGSVVEDTNDAKDLAARLFVTPFARSAIEPLRGFGAGLAATWGIEQGTPAATGLGAMKTSGQTTFFQYRAATPQTSEDSALANGARLRLSPQLYAAWGPVGVLAEYVVSRQRVRLGPTNERLVHDAWQLAATWVVFGGDASLTGVKPHEPLRPLHGEWGALEVGARVSRLDVDPDAFDLGLADGSRYAGGARSVAVGVNWYFSSHVRTMVDFEHTELPGRGGATLPAEDVVLARLQLGF